MGAYYMAMIEDARSEQEFRERKAEEYADAMHEFEMQDAAERYYRNCERKRLVNGIDYCPPPRKRRKR